MKSQRHFHSPLLMLGIVALVFGMWAGLIRIGWYLPPAPVSFALLHGPLMIAGGLGTLISLERTAVFNSRWGYLAPLLTLTGACGLIFNAPWNLGPIFILAGSVVLVTLFSDMFQNRASLATTTMALGALAWLIGNGLWLTGQPIFTFVLWWAGFLALIITGQRIEYGQLNCSSHRSESAFLTTASIFLIGLIMCVVVYDLGVRIVGFGMVGVACWLLFQECAWRNASQSNFARFIAACLLPGYLWLIVSGVAGMLFGSVPGGKLYDAWLHALFVGFVFSMIFAHTPLILSQTFGIKTRFSRSFYIHLILLQVSLLIRIGADLMGWQTMREWGGMLNAIALMLFLINTIWFGRRAIPAPKQQVSRGTTSSVR